MARTLPLERRSLAAQVADALRELIMSNTYRQGQQLRQDDLAKRLGVSHIPVREAFQLLEAEGLITNIPYKGAVVTRLSESEIEEYFDIRATLEVDLLRRAIGRIKPQAIARAREIVAKMDTAPPAALGRVQLEPARSAVPSGRAADHARVRPQDPRQPRSLRAHPAVARGREPAAGAPGAHQADRPVRSRGPRQSAEAAVESHQRRARRPDQPSQAPPAGIAMPADALVIGGGLVGLSCALNLQLQGIRTTRHRSRNDVARRLLGQRGPPRDRAGGAARFAEDSAQFSAAALFPRRRAVAAGTRSRCLAAVRAAPDPQQRSRSLRSRHRRVALATSRRDSRLAAPRRNCGRRAPARGRRTLRRVGNGGRARKPAVPRGAARTRARQPSAMPRPRKLQRCRRECHVPSQAQSASRAPGRSSTWASSPIA